VAPLGKTARLLAKYGARNGDGETSAMEPATKHLFRHLHDQRALKKNPIARRFVFNGVQYLHSLVRAAAQRCRDADIAAGNPERALRQYAIIVEGSLERKALPQVAGALGISVRQCYRERGEICQRIAIALSHETTAIASVPDVDEFALLLSNVLRRAALGDAERAVADCDALVQRVSSLVHKVAAMRTRATILADFGNADAAQDVLRGAQRIWNNCVARGDAQADGARAAMALLRWQLAHARADTGEALRYAGEAFDLLATSSASRRPLLREMHCESHYALGTARCNAGDFYGGLDCFSSLEERLIDDYGISFTTRSRIAVTAWKLRCSLVTSAQAWRPFTERIAGLTKAFESAYASGDLAAAITALDAMTQQHATAGNDAEAFRAGRLALVIADGQSSDRVRSHLAIRLALKLLPTKYARQAVSLASRAKPHACDGYHRQLIAYFRLEHALAERRFHDVLRLANEESDGREYAALTVHRALVHAEAAHALGNGRAARGLVDSAISAAERMSSAHTLLDAYRIAVKVTGLTAYRKRHREVAALFAS
jgi:hypothetical protein